MNLKTSLAIFLLLTLSVNSKFVIKKRNDIKFFPADMTARKTFHFLKSNFIFEQFTVSKMYTEIDVYLNFQKSGVLFMKAEGNENPDAVEKGDYVLIVNRSMKVFYDLLQECASKGDLYDSNMLLLSNMYKANGNVNGFNFYSKFQTFNNDMSPMEINLNLSSNHNILMKMQTTNDENVFPVLPEMENKFLSSDRDIESVSNLFDLTIRNFLTMVFYKNLAKPCRRANKNITEIINTLSTANLTQDYTPIFTSESVSNLFKEMMQDQEFNLMVEISKIFYENKSDQKLFFGQPKEIDGQPNENYSEEHEESKRNNNIKFMMRFITVKMMEFYVKKNGFDFSDYNNLTTIAISDILVKFRANSNYNDDVLNTRINSKLYMFTSPIMLELNYWVNMFSTEFVTFIDRYMSETYQFESLANMIQNPKDHSFDGNVLMNNYMIYYTLDFINEEYRFFYPKDEGQVVPGEFNMFVYKEEGTEDEEFVDESNQYEIEGSGQDDVDGSQMADDLRRIIL